MKRFKLDLSIKSFTRRQRLVIKIRALLIFLLATIWMSNVFFFINLFYTGDLIFSMGVGGFVFLAGWILYLLIYIYYTYYFKEVTGFIGSPPHKVYRRFLSEWSERKVIASNVIFLILRLVSVMIITMIAFFIKNPFLMVLIFIIVTEVPDSGIDMIFVWGLGKERFSIYNYFDDLVDITGRLIFYTQYMVLWINFLNILQLLLLVPIAFLLTKIKWTKIRWLKLFGVGVNIGVLIYFSPLSHFFIIGLIGYWLMYVIKYSHYLYQGRDVKRIGDN